MQSKYLSLLNCGQEYKPSLYIPKFQLKEYGDKQNTLGKGTFGKVSKYVTKQGEYAIKKYFDDEEDLIRYIILREITILRRLNHPNILPIYDVVLKHDTFYIVMPLAKSDLRNYMKNKLSFDDKKNIIYEILYGLAYMHSHSVMHRDFKPENILISNENRVMIADFGSSKMGHINKYYEITDNVTTLWYKSPEMLLGPTKFELLYDYSSDIWSFGCILYELYMDDILFRGDSKKDQIYKIFSKLGTPNNNIWSGVETRAKWKPNYPLFPSRLDEIKQNMIDSNIPELLTDLFISILVYDNKQRPTACKLLKHKYFDKDVDTYFPDCLTAIRYRECYPKNTLSKIDEDNRLVVFKWLLEIKNELKFSWKTFCSISWIYDICYSQLHFDDVNKLQLYTSAILYISSLYNDTYHVELNEILEVIYSDTTPIMVMKAITEILNIIDYDIGFATGHEFLMYYTENEERYIFELAEILLGLSYIHTIRYKLTPEKLAQCCIDMVKLYYDHDTTFQYNIKRVNSFIKWLYTWSTEEPEYLNSLITNKDINLPEILRKVYVILNMNKQSKEI